MANIIVTSKNTDIDDDINKNPIREYKESIHINNKL